mmetsp:Transcript_3543/g.5709  ORF Transcript_3543/g.5709 Transcript_3543/m.5709 type:complete len:424 (+) Transcript_3543:81-1352(+)
MESAESSRTDDPKRAHSEVGGAFSEWLETFVARALQVIILLLMVFTYAACPLAVSWSKVVGFEQHGQDIVPIKGRPFKEGSVLIVSWAISAVAGLVLSAVLGGVKALKSCLDWRSAFMFAPCGVGWALADVCEVLAVSRIDPATYSVLSQSRLLSAAVACWVLRGMTQTRLQWGMLLGLTLICMAYCIIPDIAVATNEDMLYRWRLAKFEFLVRRAPALELPDSDANADIHFDYAVGVSFALSKIALSVLSGVYGETRFKVKAAPDGTPPPALYVQMTQISVSSTVAAIAGYCVICRYEEESVLDLWNGPDGAWDSRTVFLALVYCWREWNSNIVTKRFDSLVKQMCNAAALVVTYIFTVFYSKEKPFSVLKALLLVIVVIAVLDYVETRRTATKATALPNPATIPVSEYAAMTSKSASAKKL